ncbi:MAG: ABC transporter permease [Halarsenatibacteraceae bacterium]
MRLNKYRLLFKKEWDSNRWKVLIVSAFLLITATTMVLQYPMVQRTLQLGILEELPDWMTSGLERQLNFNYYMADGWFDGSLAQSGTLLAVLLGMGVIGSEFQDGTLPFLLARPIDRAELFKVKLGFQLFILALFAISLTAYLGLFVSFQGRDIYLIRFLLALIPLGLKLLVAYLLAVNISLLLKEQVKSGIFSLAIILAFWVAANLTPYYNIFYYNWANMAEYYVNGSFPVVGTALLIILNTGLYGLALSRFKKIDI